MSKPRSPQLLRKLVKITITNIPFADLKLNRESDICESSGIDPDITLGDEDNTAGLIVAWYGEHLAAGGDTDPVAEDLLAEIRAEDAFGGGLSHQPGQA